ncbi:MAG TPA: tail fiber domain-containing protein, partial [Candidatus Limnocylindrales bacterium]|nr:tail fiber domain-containing protein [Candidatus Limnocylindrales bacterium]
SSALMKLRPVTFLYKPGYDKGPRTLQYGLIAEEVAQVYPDLVAYEPDGKPYTVKYQYLTTMLLNELQKQHAVVAAQREEIDSLRNELQLQRADFQQRLTSLEGLIGRASNAPPAEPEQVQAHRSAGLR